MKNILLKLLVSSLVFSNYSLGSVDIQNESFIKDIGFEGNKKISSFSKAKSNLKNANYFGIKNELYCGCEFKNGKIPKDAKCGIKARKNPNIDKQFKKA